MKTSLRFKLLTAIVSIAVVAAIAWAVTSRTVPAVGLYWLINGDPTTSPGVSAPQYQLGIRTDTPTLYYHSGTGPTQWTSLSGGGGGGSGTVTSVSCDAGTSCTPDPITGSGVITINQQLNIPNGNTIVTGVGGQLDNWNPWGSGGRTTYVEIDPNTNTTTITGIVAGNDGDYIALWNGGNGGGNPDTVTLVSQSASSSAFNRFWIADGKQVNIPNNDGVILRYDGAFGWVCFACGTSILRAQEFSADPSAAPAALTAGSNYDDYNPWTGVTMTSNVIQDVTGTGTATITGFSAAGAPNSEGRVVYWQNISTTATITFVNNGLTSSNSNRILCPNAQNLIIPPQGSVVFIYDSANAFWRVGSLGAQSGNVVVNGKESYSQCVVNFGHSLPQAYLDNWNPSCLATNTFVQVAASDNSGTYITGIDAVGNHLPVGSVLHICNEDTPRDAGVLIFRNLNPASTIGNRILTPGAGRQRNCTATPTTYCQQDSDCPSVDASNTCAEIDSDFAVGPDQCVTLEYINAGAENALQWPEWILTAQERMNSVTLQNLNFYPILYTDELDGSVDDYSPTCTSTGGSASCAAIHAYTCSQGNDAGVVCGEAGDNLDFQSNAQIYLDVGSGGATILGFHYPTPVAHPIVPSANNQGLYKWICNVGAGSLTIKNLASSFALDNIDDGAHGDNRGDFVVLPSECFEIYHQRDIGNWQVQGKRDPYFHERDVNITKGVAISGGDPNAGIANSTLFVDKTSPLNATAFLAYFRDVAVDSSPSGITSTTLAVVANATNIGGGTQHNLALETSALNGSSPTGLQVDNGGIFGGADSELPFIWYKSPDSEFDQALDVGTTLTCGQAHNLVGPTVTAQHFACSTVPSVNNGTLSADANNFDGDVTSISATSVTLTFGGGGYANFAHCTTQVQGSATVGINESTVSATAPVFSCFTYATGTSATCPNFTYHCPGH